MQLPDRPVKRTGGSMAEMGERRAAGAGDGVFAYVQQNLLGFELGFARSIAFAYRITEIASGYMPGVRPNYILLSLLPDGSEAGQKR